MFLEKLASPYESQLTKIASAISAIEEGYDVDEVLAFAAQNGVAPAEIEMGYNVFGELDKKAAAQYQYDDYLDKIAGVIYSPEATSLEKVAAAVDLFEEGVISPDDAYGIGQELGYSMEDVDTLYSAAYL